MSQSGCDDAVLPAGQQTQPNREANTLFKGPQKFESGTHTHEAGAESNVFGPTSCVCVCVIGFMFSAMVSVLRLVRGGRILLLSFGLFMSS